jgi:hypothetical protein
MLTALAQRNVRTISRSTKVKIRVARGKKEDSRLIDFVIEPARLEGYIREGAETWQAARLQSSVFLLRPSTEVPGVTLWQLARGVDAYTS